MEPTCFDEAGLDLRGEHIGWDDVQRVAIRTSSAGPWAEDVFWLVVARGEVWELPGGALQGDWVPALHRHLPRVDDLAIIEAMGCTDEALFLVFDRGAASADPEPLGSRFEGLFARLGASPGAATGRLLAAWQQPHRAYHGLRHLAECLEALDRHPPSADRDIAELALWFHDAVFEPTACDDEERSSAWLLAVARSTGIPEPSARRAAELVRSTDHHRSPERLHGIDADLVHDADLAILGADGLRFAEYEGQVRREYSQVARLTYALARGALLRSLLDAGPVYRTVEMRASHEERARRNVEALLRTPAYRLHRWGRALRRLLLS